MQAAIQRLHQGQEVALEELKAQGITGLPEKLEKFREIGWAHPMLWVLIGMGAMATLLTVPDPPPLTSLRFAGDILPISLTYEDSLWALALVPTFVGLVFGGRSLAGLVSSASALQFVGECLVFFPWLGRRLIRLAKRAGNDWPAVRRRWVLQLWVGLAFQMVVHALVLFRLHHTYRAVFDAGVREVWPAHYREYGWNDLEEVSPWCSARPRAVGYRLHFGNVVFELTRSDEEGLDIVDYIDSELVAMGKPKRRHTEESAKYCASLWSKKEERPMIEAIFKR